VELGSALLAGKIDYARALDPVTAKKVKEARGMSSADFYQSVIHAVWVNSSKKTLADPRVRRAMHLVFDRQVLVDVVKDIAPMLVGGFIYPFSEFATPAEELSRRLGYQRDPKAAVQEARRLMAKDGPQNDSKWSTATFQTLVAQIDGEIDDGKCNALIHQAEDILEQDPPLLPVAWEKIYDGWYNYVRGHNPGNYFGIYDLVRWDTVWLDKEPVRGVR
jgi:ABC-type transport system substrate-binding protein